VKASEYLERLADSLAKLPGVGKRSAERMAYRLVSEPHGLLAELAQALQEAGAQVRFCPQCGCIMTAGEALCRLCADAGRDQDVVCVVEDPIDILTIEKSGGFHGRYHALMGKISPMQGSGPDDIRLHILFERIEREHFKEIILALNTNVESDATAAYIGEALKNRGIRVSRLAFGLPVGSGIAYADPLTLARALKGRQEV
jgi:recombination protein RecR